MNDDELEAHILHVAERTVADIDWSWFGQVYSAALRTDKRTSKRIIGELCDAVRGCLEDEMTSVAVRLRTETT